MSQAIEVFATLRADTDRFGSEARRGIAGAMPGIAKAVAAGMAVVGGVIAATAVQGIRAFAGFERQMNEVFTLLPGISKAAMDEMSGQVLALAKDMGTLPEEVVPALYQALSAGVPQDNVFAFLETANRAAIGGATTLETAVDGISSVVNAYGADVLDAAEASDIMFTAVRLGKTDFEQMSSALFNVIPTASSLGVEFGDVAAALATITAQGTPTRVATTQLRQLFVELSRDGSKVAETFEEISGKSFRDFVAEGGNVQDALRHLEGHADDTGVSLADLFSSVEAGNAALGLTGQASDAFTAALKEMGTSAGATEAAYEQMDQGLSRAMDRIKAGWEVLKITIGEQLAPVVERFGNWIINNMPEIEAKIVSFFAGLTSAFEAVLSWWDTNGPKIKAAITGVWETASSAMGGFTESMGEHTEQWDRRAERLEKVNERLGNTVNRVMGGISADHDETAGNAESMGRRIEAALGRWIDVQLATANALAASMEFIAGRFEWLADRTRSWQHATVLILLIVRQNWREFSEAVGGVAERFGGFMDAMKRYARNWRVALIEDAAAAMAGMLKSVREEGGTLLKWFADLPGRVASALGDLTSTLVAKGKELIGGFVSGIRSALPGVGDAVGDVAAAAQPPAAKTGRAYIGPGGGSVGKRVGQVLSRFPSARISSAYRSPEHNRRVGGARNSLHMDRSNPAHDIVAPSAATLDAIAAQLRGMGPWREFLWRVPNHAPGDNMHIHVAHDGGMVSANWPTLPGLKGNERPAILEIGEKVVPKGGDGGQAPITLVLNVDGRRFATATAPAMRDELRHLEVTYS